VAPDTIEARRVAVLRGRALTSSGDPLPGVTITILDHPEFGQTLTRADGMFDLVVNGGGSLVVKYEKAGRLPAQRHVQAPWQDYTWLPDVVLIGLDANVTPVDLSAPIPMQVVEGSVISDDDGQRRARLLIPQGTGAELILPGGVTQPITTLNVRATEYTVGADGQRPCRPSFQPRAATPMQSSYLPTRRLQPGRPRSASRSRSISTSRTS